MYIDLNEVIKQTGATKGYILKLVRDGLLSAVKQPDGSLKFHQGEIDSAQERGLLPIAKKSKLLF